jgi:uncharacterized protein involved in exopolysaccharide biosynthesis
VTGQRPAFDIGLVLPVLGRVLRSWSFIGILVLGLGLTGAKAFRSRPVYQSEAVLLYQDRGSSNPVSAQRDAPSSRRIGLTLQEMLFSHSLLQKLISEFGLYAGTVARFGVVGGVEEIQKRDLRFKAREGYTFRVSFDSTSPELAQLVATRATELLIKAYTDSRVLEAKETERFLDSEKSRAEEELRSRESELALFMAQHPEVGDSNSARGEGLSSDSSAPETASLGYEMQALQLRERLAQLRGRPASSSESAQPGVPRAMSEARLRAEAELAAAQRELADKKSRFTEEYPDVKGAATRVESAKARLRHLEENAAAASSHAPVAPSPVAPAPSAADQNEIRMVQQQLDLLEKQMRAARSHGRRSGSRATPVTDPVVLGRARAQYAELERRTRESRDHLGLLESRQFQAEIQTIFATQAKQGELVVMDPAYKPAVPIRSDRSKILAVGIFGSLLFASAIGLALVLRDDRIRRAVDLRRFDLPDLLCEVPPP